MKQFGSASASGSVVNHALKNHQTHHSVRVRRKREDGGKGRRNVAPKRFTANCTRQKVLRLPSRTLPTQQGIAKFWTNRRDRHWMVGGRRGKTRLLVLSPGGTGDRQPSDSSRSEQPSVPQARGFWNCFIHSFKISLTAAASPSTPQHRTVSL